MLRLECQLHTTGNGFCCINTFECNLHSIIHTLKRWVIIFLKEKFNYGHYVLYFREQVWRTL